MYIGNLQTLPPLNVDDQFNHALQPLNLPKHPYILAHTRSQLPYLPTLNYQQVQGLQSQPQVLPVSVCLFFRVSVCLFVRRGVGQVVDETPG